MSKSYIQKITPFIDNMRISIGGDEPTIKLNAMMLGDTFKNFHFNKSYKITKDDFYFADESQQIGFAAQWSWQYNKSSASTNVIMCSYMPKGSEVPVSETKTIIAQDDILMLALQNGLFIYLNDEAYRLMLEMPESIPEYIDIDTFKAGWQFAGDTLRDLVAEYPFAFEHYDLTDEGAFGYIPVDGDQPLYDCSWNGNIIGLTEDDYCEVEGE